MEVVKKCDRIKGETYILKGEPRVWLGCAWGCKCGKYIPYFNLPGLKAEYCSKCKSLEMIDVKNKKCVTCRKKGATFNLEGKYPLYCNDCKTQGMINVVNKRCKCGKRPCFNLEGKRPLYCSDCKEIDMVDVRSKRCASCRKKRATFNFKGGRPEYCSKCRSSEMIDVKNKRCYCGKKRANFNYPGLKAIYCNDCRLPEMTDVVTKKCATCKETQPKFNCPGKPAKYCHKCRKADMVNVVSKRCLYNDKIPGVCDQWSNPKYKGYCTHCFSHLFPNDPLTAQIKKKTYEIKVRDFINSKFDGFVHDKPLWTGNCDCTHRRRIDHRRLISNTLLCIETDENKHSSYNNQDELDRYDDLMMVFSGKWIFIRFNPNTSYLDNGKRRNPSLESRLPELEKEIQRQIKRIENSENDKMLEIVKMFY